MNESITSRVARLMSGSVNALVDAVENASPELVMEQAIREVDSAIADTQAELGQQIAQKHLASKKLIEENNRYEVLTDIQDLEDGEGGMDFKITGTDAGLTAIQLDTKTNGLTEEIIAKTLTQGRAALNQILHHAFFRHHSLCFVPFNP